jgi:hypothetical protein
VHSELSSWSQAQRLHHQPSYGYRVDQSGYPKNISNYPTHLYDQPEYPTPVVHDDPPDESSSDDGDLVALKKELHEDVDKSFEKNMGIFQRKLNVQRQQLAAAISDVVVRQGDRVITAVSSGPHDRIVDVVRLSASA